MDVSTKSKLIRTSTVAISLDILLKGQLHFLDRHYNVIAVSGDDNHLHNVNSREKVKVVPVEMQRKISPIKDLVSLYKLYVLFKKEKPEIVHSITPKAGLLSMTAAYFANVPIRIHTFTGLIFPSRTGIMQKILIFMDKILCRLATNIYPEGEGVKNDLIQYNITRKPLRILANGNVNGIDVAYYSSMHFSESQNTELKTSLGILPDDFVFVFVGRLVRDKGMNELVAAFVDLQKQNNSVKLLLVGNFENDLDPLLPITMSEMSSNPNIILTGYQNDVRPYFAISDALVFPSYREGFPNVVIQAGAMGLPSIVADINGCNEIILDAQNGIIIPVKDSDAVFNAMFRLFSDAPYFNHLRSNSREMIVSRYDQKLVWDALLDEYQKLERNV